MWEWISNNISWLIPLIVSVIFSVLAIYLSYRNTRKQNAANQRPYLTVTDLEEAEPRSDKYIVLCGVTEKQRSSRMFDEPTIKAGYNISVKNIGYGIASRVKLIGINKSMSVFESWLSGSKDKDCLSVLDIGKETENRIALTINDYTDYNLSNSKDLELTVPILLMYSDLYDNIYSSMLIIAYNRLEKTVSYTCYPDGTAHFNYVLEHMNAKYRTYKNVYKEHFFRTQVKKQTQKRRKARQ